MKKNLSRILAIILVAIMSLSLFACDDTFDKSSNNLESGATTAATTVATTAADPDPDLTPDPTPNPTPDPTPDPNNGDNNDPKEIKNIILIIGDGMGLEHISAGQLYVGKKFAFTDWQFTNVNTDSVNTSGKGSVLTDSAASGTALATGHLTVNSYIGKNHLGTNVTTILDAALALSKSTGVVTTDTLCGATPSAFSGHSTNRNNSAEIANSQISSGVNLLCGDTDSVYSSRRTAFEGEGYAYCDNFNSLNSTFTSSKALWQLNLEGTGTIVPLSDTTVKALEYLDQDPDGFVLMVEQAHIDKYSHNNDFAGMVKSVKSLNDTVEAIMNWIGDRTDTAVLITADHETGGLTVSNTPNALSRDYTSSLSNSKIYYNFSSGNHTNSKVGLFVYGIKPDFSKYSYYGSHHLIKNINVYNLMYDILNPSK